MKNKKFYYHGVDYLHRDYTETYTRETGFINLYRNESGDEYFNFRGKRFKLENFNNLSVICNGFWIESEDGEEVYLSMEESHSFCNPYFIEFSEDNCKIRLYKYMQTETF